LRAREIRTELAQALSLVSTVARTRTIPLV
jgi:hypothetical protein